MTREEAIKVLRTESVEIGGNAVSVARWLTALDAAVKALEDVPDKDVGKNEPLTLDELREMEGQPAYIVENTEYWAIVNSFDQAGVYLLSYGNPDDMDILAFTARPGWPTDRSRRRGRYENLD